MTRSHDRSGTPPAWLALAILCAPASAAGATSSEAGRSPDREKDWGVALYAGRHTDGSWRESIAGQTGYYDAYLAAAALSRTFRRAENRSWSLEFEGNVARHFGDQRHWELNGLVSARWHRFPWSHRVATTAAIGTGPSYAFRRPPSEIERHGSTRRLLAFMQIELTAGPPGGDWEALLRLHHRSPAFGLFGHDGGVNTLTGGVRIRF